ncbi:MAG: hypothetical protein ABIX46_08480, partial [Burkholderiaceae bacterium]
LCDGDRDIGADRAADRRLRFVHRGSWMRRGESTSSLASQVGGATLVPADTVMTRCAAALRSLAAEIVIRSSRPAVCRTSRGPPTPQSAP